MLGILKAKSLSELGKGITVAQSISPQRSLHTSSENVMGNMWWTMYGHKHFVYLTRAVVTLVLISETISFCNKSINRSSTTTANQQTKTWISSTQLNIVTENPYSNLCQFSEYYPLYKCCFHVKLTVTQHRYFLLFLWTCWGRGETQCSWFTRSYRNGPFRAGL